MKKRTVYFTQEEVDFIRELFTWGRKASLVLLQAVFVATGLMLLFTNNFKIFFIAGPLALLFFALYRNYLIKGTAFEGNLGEKKKKGKYPYQLSSVMENFILNDFRLFSILHKKPVGKFDKDYFSKMEEKIRKSIGRPKLNQVKEAVRWRKKLF